MTRTRLGISHLILACRNVKKGEIARDDIKQTTHCESKTTIEVWELDLDHYESVLAFTERVSTQLPRLDGFVANAGLELSQFEMSEDCERSLTVNAISTYLVALGVLPKMQESASNYVITPTLTFVGSMGHVFAPSDQLQPVQSARDTFEALSDPKMAQMGARYAISKLIQHLCFRELATRLPLDGDNGQGRVVVNCVNPGWCKTALQTRYGSEGLLVRLMALIFKRTSEEGSRTLVHGVTAGSETHGRYLSECQVKEMSAWVRSDAGERCGERLFVELTIRLEILSPGITKCLTR